jgi:hypothetical protein
VPPLTPLHRNGGFRVINFQADSRPIRKLKLNYVIEPVNTIPEQLFPPRNSVKKVQRKNRKHEIGRANKGGRVRLSVPTISREAASLSRRRMDAA